VVSCVTPILLADGLLRPTAEIRRGWIDGETLSERFAADQHAEAHFVSACEGDLGIDRSASQHDRYEYDWTVAARSRRAGDGAVVDAPCLNQCGVGVRTLPWSDEESHPRDALVLKEFDVVGVNCRCASAGIDLGLDGIDAPFRKGDPFSPTDCVHWVSFARPARFWRTIDRDVRRTHVKNVEPVNEGLPNWNDTDAPLKTDHYK
jgi:hypothetical protein